MEKAKKKKRHRKRYMSEEWYEKHIKLGKKKKLMFFFSERESLIVEDVFDLLEKQVPRVDRASSEEILKDLIKEKIIVKEPDGGSYIFTDKGRKRGARYQKRSGKIFNALYNPETAPRIASKVGIASNVFLAFLIITIGYLSGSLALLSKGIDSGLDVLVSIGIWAGIRAGKERLAALLVSVVMTSSGLFLFYGSVNLIFSPEELEFVIPAVIVAVIAILINFAMMTYKYFVGNSSGTFSLVADAYHNRIDVFASLGVLIAVLGSALGFHSLDPIVGLIVAVIIVESGVGLLGESLRSLSGEEVDWSKYSMWYEKHMRDARYITAERLILDILKNEKLTFEEILSCLQENDPFLVHFSFGDDELLKRYSGFTPEIVTEVLNKMQNEGSIILKGEKYSL
ncbi:MAG: cation diffusion facilitator family transporter [Candidatus Wukongarchaeota archaeon]|nr:cation diffusion facilitator family transporter [Candidatus Wukongarchaeota archaeon]